MEMSAILNAPIQLKAEDLRRREIYRYLQMKEADATVDIRKKVENNIHLLLRTAHIRHYGEIRPLSLKGGGIILAGDLSITSTALQQNLKDSTELFLFGITLGMGVDRLIYRLSRQNAADSAIIYAISTELLETAANVLCKRVKESVREAGFDTYPRFSPGFADYTLENQQNLLRTLMLEKRLGIGLTESNMLVPTKTVTALMGIYPREKIHEN